MRPVSGSSKVAVKNLADGTYEAIRAATKAHKVSDSERALHDRIASHYIPHSPAGALALPMEGTVVEPVRVIKDHLAENPGRRANELRFSGLLWWFEQTRCRCVNGQTSHRRFNAGVVIIVRLKKRRSCVVPPLAHVGFPFVVMRSHASDHTHVPYTLHMLPWCPTCLNYHGDSSCNLGQMRFRRSSNSSTLLPEPGV